MSTRHGARRSVDGIEKASLANRQCGPGYRPAVTKNSPRRLLTELSALCWAGDRSLRLLREDRTLCQSLRGWL